MTKYLSKPKVAERYGKTTRTIDNWRDRTDLAFPQPIRIGGREHYPVEALDEFDRRMGAVGPSISEDRHAA